MWQIDFYQYIFFLLNLKKVKNSFATIFIFFVHKWGYANVFLFSGQDNLGINCDWRPAADRNTFGICILTNFACIFDFSTQKSHSFCTLWQNNQSIAIFQYCNGALVQTWILSAYRKSGSEPICRLATNSLQRRPQLFFFLRHRKKVTFFAPVVWLHSYEKCIFASIFLLRKKVIRMLPIKFCKAKLVFWHPSASKRYMSV